MDLGNYSQVGGAAEKKEENGEGEKEKKEEEESGAASEKPKVRRMICHRASPSHHKVQEAAI